MISNSLESTVYSYIPDRSGISNPDFDVLVVEGMAKSEYREKPLGQLCRTKNESQPQTLPTYDFDSGASTRTTLVGVECCHHCTTFAPQQGNKIEQGWCKYFSYRGGFFYFIPFLPSLCLKQFSLSL